MTNSISLTIPLNDYNALTRAADMLHGLAVDMKKQGNAPICSTTEGPGQTVDVTGVDQNGERVVETVTLSTEPKVVQLPGKVADVQIIATVSGEPTAAPALETIDLEPLRQETTAAEAFPNVDPSTIVTVTPTVATVTPFPASVGVELDKNGLPWDERIHAGTKSKKADGSWKAKRGVDKDFVAQVEAELRAAMAVPTPNEQPAPVVASPTTTPAIAPIVDAVPNVAATAAATVTPQAGSPTPNVTTPTVAVTPALHATAPGITTLPALMAAATGAGKTQADMQAAAVAAGLASVALLGARPDLIPTVAASLGLGG
jgi:hypothetical protein